MGAAGCRRGRFVVAVSSCARLGAARWQHFGGNIRSVSLCRRLVVPPCRRRVVVAASSPRHRRRRRRVVVASSSRRVVAASLSVPASILTGIPTVVVAVAVVAVSSVPASILTSPPGPVVWVRSEEGKQCSDCGAAGRLRGCSDCEGPGGCSDCEDTWELQRL